MVKSLSYKREWIWVVGVSLLTLGRLALVPYGVRFLRYPSVTLFFRNCLWTLFIIRRVFYLRKNNNITLLENQLPKRRPFPLWFILPLIELVSLLIQSLTLLLRITVNLRIGHFLIFFRRKLIKLVSLAAGVLLIFYERFVVVIQATVFILLLDNYQSYFKS